MEGTRTVVVVKGGHVKGKGRRETRTTNMELGVKNRSKQQIGQHSLDKQLLKQRLIQLLKGLFEG